MLSPADLEHPIVQAPMGGGPSTAALAAAVSGAGGLGFLAAGYKTVEAVRAEVEELRGLTDAPFGVNLFVPGPPAADPEAVRRYAESLAAEAHDHRVALGEPRHDDDGWEAKLDLLVEAAVPVASFTFGCPPPETIGRLQAAGTAVWVTVTTVAEALDSAVAGADALVVQGVEAGGHRASFDDAAPGEMGLLALLQLLFVAVHLPLVATGGIANGRGVAAVLAAGATAAQLGTAFMLADEAATHPAHARALRRDRGTALTRAFTGRTGRGIVNRFLTEHGPRAPSAYPEVHHLTAPLRSAARDRGDAEALHLWAGQAHTLVEPAPAAELVRLISAEAREALREAAGRGGRLY